MPYWWRWNACRFCHNIFLRGKEIQVASLPCRVSCYFHVTGEGGGGGGAGVGGGGGGGGGGAVLLFTVSLLHVCQQLEFALLNARYLEAAHFRLCSHMEYLSSHSCTAIYKHLCQRRLFQLSTILSNTANQMYRVRDVRKYRSYLYNFILCKPICVYMSIYGE